VGDGIGDMAFWLAVGSIGVGFWVVIAPVFKAAATRIASKGVDVARLDEMEHRLADLETQALTSGEVESQFARFDDIEGRIDFAERLLTEQQEAVLSKRVADGEAG
jgi:hypothetical protein